MSPRIVAALSTSAARGSLAVAVDDEIRHEEVIDEGLVHGREIVPRFDRAFRSLGIAPTDVELVVVDVGPGSFTGMRVGVTIGKMLAWSAGAEVVGIPGPDVIADAAGADAGARLTAALAVVLDAKRGEVYLARYERTEGRGSAPHGKNGGVRRVGDIRILPREESVRQLSPGTLLLGDGAPLIADRVADAPTFPIAPRDAWIPRASRLLRLGLRARGSGAAVPAAELSPYYVRSSAPILRKAKPRP